MTERTTSATTGPPPITVLLVDEQALIRSAVRQALVRRGIRVVGEARSAEAVIQTALDLRPDVVLIDVAFGGTSGLEAIQQLSLLAPASRILVLTATKERDPLLEAIVAGACGYILKDARSGAIADAVRAVAAGECVISPQIAGELLTYIRDRGIRVAASSSDDGIRAALTERELEVFKRLASGESNRAISRALSLSEKTVKNHVASILAKLHLENRVQAAVEAVRSGFSCVAGLFLLEALSDEADLPSAVVSFLVGG